MQKTLIGGVGYNIYKGRTLIGGVGHNIYKGRTLIDGAGHDIFLGTPLKDLDVGDIITINVAGVPTEFIIIHEGNPDPTIYDKSCDGVWVLMKGVYKSHHWDNDSGHYPDSDIHNYLNNEFIYLLDTDVRSIVKQVKIPYARPNTREDGGNWTENDYSSVYLKSNGLSAKVFLLSGPEVNWDDWNGWYSYEGSCLDYFKDMDEVDIRRGGIPHPTKPTTHYANWWLRSKVRAYYDDQLEVWFVLGAGNHESKGSVNGESVEEKHGVWIRPAMILPHELLIDPKNYTILI